MPGYSQWHLIAGVARRQDEQTPDSAFAPRGAGMTPTVTLPASCCFVCHRPVSAPRTQTCDADCAQAWRVLEYFRAQETAHPIPTPISLALVRLARGEPALVR